jgi:hypothetical protein
MDESQVRRVVQEELRRGLTNTRFGYQNVPLHEHDGVEAPKVKDNNINRNPAILGSITLSTEGQTYTLETNTPFTPRKIECNGLVYNPDSGNNIRVITTGAAYLGEGYYFQPSSSNSVVVGDIRYPAPTKQPDGSTKNVPLQYSSWFWANRNDNDQYFAAVSENHIVSVAVGATIYARVTVVDFSKDRVVLSVPFLESGYEVIANFLIT